MPGGDQRLVTDVIVAARNCAARLKQTIERLPARLLRSVVVVDNGSTDSTAQVARDAGAVVLREPRVGYGHACRRGLRHLESLPRPPDVVVFMAGDGSDDPEDLPRLLAPIRDDNAELVIGVRPPELFRRPQTRLAIGLIGVIYRHRFEDVGPFRAVRLPALVALGLTDSGSGWDVEMQVKALKLGLHIVEVPVGSGSPGARAKGGRGLARSVGGTGRVLFQILRHSTAR